MNLTILRRILAAVAGPALLALVAIVGRWMVNHWPYLTVDNRIIGVVACIALGLCAVWCGWRTDAR
jgi:hypothetical protein